MTAAFKRLLGWGACVIGNGITENSTVEARDAFEAEGPIQSGEVRRLTAPVYHKDGHRLDSEWMITRRRGRLYHYIVRLMPEGDKRYGTPSA